MTLCFECDRLVVGWPNKILIKDFIESAPFDRMNYVLPITGQTGIGKSTLLYALAGMARPLSGSVTWHFPDTPAPVTWSGDKASFNSINDLRRYTFGFLLQDTRMIECFTVGENLLHVLRLRGVADDLKRRVVRAVADVTIGNEDVHELLATYPVALSGGQRQRMALAVAIAHDPVVLFADEPTASLDDRTALEVLGTIRSWLDRAKGKRAFVIVTHRIETLKVGLHAKVVWDLQFGEANRIRAIEKPIGSSKIERAKRAGES